MRGSPQEPSCEIGVQSNPQQLLTLSVLVPGDLRDDEHV
jgi:hypothetical protein